MAPLTEKMKEFRQNSLKIYRELEELKKTKTRIVVHLGICGASVGAKEVRQSFVRLVQEREMSEQVLVEVAGCAGLCSMEPLVQVLKPGMRAATYCLVTEEMAEAIFTQHIINGVVIQPWLLSTKLERR